MLYTTDGLVLRETAVGENDKIINLLTPAEGQITVSAKGAKSGKSKLAGATKLFSYSNFEIYKKGEYRYAREAYIIEPFFGLSASLEAMSLASYLCDVASDITGEGVASVDILRMTLNAFYVLSKGTKDPALVKAVYELRAAGYSGFMPDVRACAECGKENPEKPMLDVMNGCLYCESCLEKHRAKHKIELLHIEDAGERDVFCRLSPSSLAALRFALGAKPERMFSFGLDDDFELKLFSHAAETYLLNHLEHDFDTLKFYKSIL